MQQQHIHDDETREITPQKALNYIYLRIKKAGEG